MTKQLSKIALAAVVALVCFGIRAHESSRQAPEKKSTNSDNPLQGLTKVGVIIDSTPLDKIGLSEERLRSEVVSRLRSAGITVVGNKDSDTNGQTPVLKISVFFFYADLAAIRVWFYLNSRKRSPPTVTRP